MNVHKLKQEICDIGRRIYNRGFAAANDGNITYRIGENEVLCTPTMISKGFMKPEDICTRRHGKATSSRGRRKRSSEVPAAPGDHEGAARRQERRPLPSAACHGLCRGPRADPAMRAARGRGVSGRRADHDLRNARRAEVRRHGAAVRARSRTSIILANHGTVSFGETVERAYWWTEILDAYCRILMLARDLGKVNYLSERRPANCWT